MAAQTFEDILSAKHNQTIARLERRRALSVLMPRATAFAGTRIYDDPDSNAPDLDTMGIRVNQSFTLNGKELIALDVTEDAMDQAKFNLAGVRNDVAFEVATRFYQILSAQSVEAIAQADVDRLTRHKESVERRLKLGDAIKTALFRANAELSKAQTEHVRATNAVTLARASLKVLVPLEASFTLIEFNKIMDPPLTLGDLKSQALAGRPEIKAFQRNLDMAIKTIKYERSDRFPTLTLEGTYADARSEFDTPFHGVSNTRDYSLEAKLDFTLFDGGLITAQVGQALAKKQQAELDLARVKKNILLACEKAWLDFQTATSSLVSLHHELEAATENLDAVSMQFNYGTADSVDMMDANTLFVTAQRRLSDATYTHALSRLEMLYIQGDIYSFLADES
jgi:outer membrane protein